MLKDVAIATATIVMESLGFKITFRFEISKGNNLISD